MKWCSKCGELKIGLAYNRQSSNRDGLRYDCRDCQKLSDKERKPQSPEYKRQAIKLFRTRHPERERAKVAARKAAKLQRTPSWSDLGAIAGFYEGCPEGHEVDHIIPLRGKTVSGLHIRENLQYLSIEENRSKSNIFS